MDAVWTALIGVVAGGLMALGSTLVQQRRTWRREDQVRGETRTVEQRREERREVLKLFTDFLASCNRTNVRFALVGDSADAADRQRFRDLVDERWAQVQGSGVVFLAVGHDQATREAISALIDATEALAVAFRQFEEPTDDQLQAFSVARRGCERAMRDYMTRLSRLPNARF